VQVRCQHRVSLQQKQRTLFDLHGLKDSLENFDQVDAQAKFGALCTNVFKHFDAEVGLNLYGRIFQSCRKLALQLFQVRH
jgi:hypothetical protein